MCIYSPMPHTLSYCALIGKCTLIRSNTVGLKLVCESMNFSLSFHLVPADYSGSIYCVKSRKSGLTVKICRIVWDAQAGFSFAVNICIKHIF